MIIGILCTLLSLNFGPTNTCKDLDKPALEIILRALYTRNLVPKDKTMHVFIPETIDCAVDNIKYTVQKEEELRLKIMRQHSAEIDVEIVSVVENEHGKTAVRFVSYCAGTKSNGLITLSCENDRLVFEAMSYVSQIE